MSLERSSNEERDPPAADSAVKHQRKVKRRVVKAKSRGRPEGPVLSPSDAAPGLPEKEGRYEFGCTRNGMPVPISFESCPEVDSRSLHVPEEPVRETVCHNCDTEIELNADVCPICGAPLNAHDNGLVRLFSDMKFEDDCSGEIDCPFCGEKVILQDGSCPSCLELVHAEDGIEPSERVEPVVHGENVVFVHLDVERGELDCLLRSAHRLALEHMTVKLED